MNKMNETRSTNSNSLIIIVKIIVGSLVLVKIKKNNKTVQLFPHKKS